jgi:hypothetical protein
MAQFLLRNIKNYYPMLVVLILFFSLTSCGGKEDLEDQQDYNPVSPLPPRVEVVPTPAQQVVPDQKDATTENEQLTPTPSPISTQIMETPTPTPTSTPTPTTTPTPTPLKKKPTPAPDSQKMKVPPTPPPEAMPLAIETPKAIQDNRRIETKTIAGGESSNPQNETGDNLLEFQQETEENVSDKQIASKPQTEDSKPVATLSGLTLDKLVVCSKILNREPANCGDTFSLSKLNRIYTWIKVSGVNPPKVVKHIYYREGAMSGTVKLTLNHESMRTWSQWTFNPQQALGKWKVVITTEDDDVIATREFTVVR